MNNRRHWVLLSVFVALVMCLSFSALAEDRIVTLSEDMVFESTLIIPSGNSLTLNGSGKISGTSAVSDLFEVEAGASLTIGGSVELNGQGISGSIISTKGSVTVMDDAVITGATVVSSYSGTVIAEQQAAATGAIEVLSGGSLTLKGGNITGNVVQSDFCGTVYVGNGGSISIENGAKISNNFAYTGASNAKSYSLTRASSGVLMHNGATGTMTGGEICNNTAMRGAGVMLYSTDTSKKASFTLTGGEIYSNKGQTSVGSMQSSGAVHVEGNASFQMRNGISATGAVTVPEIRNNSVKGICTFDGSICGVGGGVCVRDPGLSAPNSQSTSPIFNTEFIMDGGKICNNTADTGGGVYCFSNGVILRAGVISGNKAPRTSPLPYEYEVWPGVNGGMGGGVYCEGNTVGYCMLQIRDAVISNNTASFQGGGLWFCPTGAAVVYSRHGASIHDNTARGMLGMKANGSGDDFFFGAAVEEDDDGKVTKPKYLVPDPSSYSGTTVTEMTPSLTLSDQALSGVEVDWYMDGFAYSNSMDGTYNNSLFTNNTTLFGTGETRYTEGRNPKVSGVTNGYWYYNRDLDANHFYAYSLKCIASDEALQKADLGGKLFITGNSSAFGGGVAANGGVTIGEKGDPSMDLVLEKRWEDNNNQYGIRPRRINIDLKLNGQSYQTVTLSAENNWRVELKNLPLGKYSVSEKPMPFYNVIYSSQDLSVDGEEKLKLITTNALDFIRYQASKEILPPTGDSSLPLLWLLLALSSVIGIVALKRRSRKA